MTLNDNVLLIWMLQIALLRLLVDIHNDLCRRDLQMVGVLV